MKVLPIALVLALPVVAGCGQASNQSSLPFAGAQAIGSAPSVRAHPDSCLVHETGSQPTGGFIKVKNCGGHVARLYYGSGSSPVKVTTQGFTSNPGGVPVPAGETPVLFVQMNILPGPGPSSFTPPMVPPTSNRSRITGLVAGNTYKLYAYQGATLLGNFPMTLGTPNPSGTLIFTANPWSPLPLLPSLPPNSTVSFELTTP